MGQFENPPYYLSAYTIAVKHGFCGTEQEWLESLIGPQGDTGKSAYQYAVEAGYTGTEKAFGENQIGQGKTAYEYAVEGGYTGTVEDFRRKMAAEYAEKDHVLADTGGVVTGDIAMSGNKITDLGSPSKVGDAVPKSYADTKLALSGGTMTGPIAMGGNRITDLGTPVGSGDAVTVDYLGTALNNAFKTAHRTATATLTVAGWSNLQQSVSVSDVTASKVVIVSPEAASYADYTEANVRCIAQGTSTLTFACDEVPASSLTVNALVIMLS